MKRDLLALEEWGRDEIEAIILAARVRAGWIAQPSEEEEAGADEAAPPQPA